MTIPKVIERPLPHRGDGLRGSHSVVGDENAPNHSLAATQRAARSASRWSAFSLLAAAEEKAACHSGVSPVHLHVGAVGIRRVAPGASVPSVFFDLRSLRRREPRLFLRKQEPQGEVLSGWLAVETRRGASAASAADSHLGCHF